MEHISHTVMGIFKAFNKKNKTNVRLTKIACVDGKPPKIPIGLVVEGLSNSDIRVGFSFNISPAILSDGTKWNSWCSSIIQEILPGNTFRTKNSIYKWEKTD